METQLADDPLNMHSDPLRMQQTVFHLIQVWLEFVPKNTTVMVASMRGEGAAQVLVTDEATPRAEWFRKQIHAPHALSAENREPSDPDPAVLGLTMAKLGSLIDEGGSHSQGNRVTLRFPLDNS